MPPRLLKHNLSIITVSLNNRDGLQATIESVAAQTARAEIEHIIVDGGSADGSQSLFALADACISEPDRGIYDAMNKGTALALAPYLLFLNAGDTLADPTVVERALKHEAWGRASIIAGNAVVVKDGKTVGHKEAPAEPTGIHFFRYGLCHQAVFIEKALLEELGGYSLEYPMVADMRFFCDALLMRDATYATLPFSVARFDAAGISSTRREELEKEKARMLRELLPARIHADYFQMIKGDTPLQRVINRAGRKSLLYKTLQIIAVIAYAPRSAYNRLKIRLS